MGYIGFSENMVSMKWPVVWVYTIFGPARLFFFYVPSLFGFGMIVSAKEKVSFVVNSGMFTGLLAILLPFLIAAAQGPREFKRLPVPWSKVVGPCGRCGLRLLAKRMCLNCTYCLVVWNILIFSTAKMTKIFFRLVETTNPPWNDPEPGLKMIDRQFPSISGMVEDCYVSYSPFISRLTLIQGWQFF